MLKYLRNAVVFQEIPDEITLTLEITNCPHQCKNCHSPELQQDIGQKINIEEIEKLLKNYPGITCICFMGGDRNHKDIIDLAKEIKNKFKLKVAMYSGDDVWDDDLANYLDYYKIGSFKEVLGPLNKKTTNQKLFKLPEKIDITYKF